MGAAPLVPTIPDLVRWRAESTPSGECVRFTDRSLTFADLHAASCRYAAALRSLGVQPGERVAVMLPNGLDFPVIWLAVVAAGAIVVPLNTSYRNADLRHVLADSGARAIVLTPEYVDLLAQVAPRCPQLREQLIIGEWEVGNDTGMARAADASAIATLQYTSGTTGFPKGCVLTHAYWLTLARAAQGASELGPNDVVLATTPFCYMDPTWNLLMCLMVGCPLVVLPRFSPSTFWRTVRENGVTFFYCLGTMPMFLLKQPEDATQERSHRVRLVLCSGIPAQFHVEFERRWECPWREAYGTTEVGAATLTHLAETDTVGSGSMGRLLDGWQARVVDPGKGAEAAVDEPGELVLRGPAMMQGYWNNPDATAAYLRDGWAHTGDLVRRDARGYFYLVGRLKDMVRRSGENIATAEVEAVLAEHSAVRAAACVGVPDDLRGEEVKAFLVPQPGVTATTETAEHVLAHARRRLAAFKVPRYITFVDALPLTASEKVAKHELLRSAGNPRQGVYDAVRHTWS